MLPHPIQGGNEPTQVFWAGAQGNTGDQGGDGPTGGTGAKGIFWTLSLLEWQLELAPAQPEICMF